VVAREDDYEDRAGGVFGQAVGLAIDSWQREIRRKRADGKDGMRFGSVG